MEPNSPEPEQPHEPNKKREKAKPKTVEQLRRALSHASSNATYERDDVTGMSGRTTSRSSSNGALITASEATDNTGHLHIFGSRTELVGEHAVSSMLSLLPGSADVPVNIEVTGSSGQPVDETNASLPDAVLLKIEGAKMKHVEEEHPDPDDPSKKVKILLASEQGVQDFLAELVSTYPTTEAGEDPEILRKERERFLELVGEYYDFADENLLDPDERSEYPEYFFFDDPDVDTGMTIRDFQREGDKITALDVSIGAHVADSLTMDHEFTIGKIPETGTDLYISTTAQRNDWSPQQVKMRERRDEITSQILDDGGSWDDVVKALRSDTILERLQTENMAAFGKGYTPQTKKVKPGDKNLRWAIDTLEHYKDRKGEVLSIEDEDI